MELRTISLPLSVLHEMSMEEKEEGISLFIMLPVLAFFCMGMVLVGIYPLRPQAFTGWFALYLFSLPVLVSIEWLGDMLFGSKYTSKVSSGIRLVYGVVGGVLVIVLTAILLNSAVPLLSEWGA